MNGGKQGERKGLHMSRKFILWINTAWKYAYRDPAFMSNVPSNSMFLRRSTHFTISQNIHSFRLRMHVAFTHTHTHAYIYTYTEREMWIAVRWCFYLVASQGIGSQQTAHKTDVGLKYRQLWGLDQTDEKDQRCQSVHEPVYWWKIQVCTLLFNSFSLTCNHIVQ